LECGGNDAALDPRYFSMRFKLRVEIQSGVVAAALQILPSSLNKSISSALPGVAFYGQRGARSN